MLHRPRSQQFATTQKGSVIRKCFYCEFETARRTKNTVAIRGRCIYIYI